MIGKSFGIICTVSVVFSVIFGKTRELCSSIISGASKSVSLTLSLMGIMALWSGIMEVLKESGAISKLSKIMRPILKFIFPKSFKNNVATEEIVACVSANLLGMANASTPLAIKAIEKLNEKNNSEEANEDMITLAILGCSSFNLIPTTIIALRQAAGASITYQIIFPVWICSFLCALTGIILSRICAKIYGKN